MKKDNIIWGTILIIAGILLLGNMVFDLKFLSISYLWPLFVLVPGILFETGYFTDRKNPGLLVPGGMLTIIGMLFLFEEYTGWAYSEYTWPIYILAVAIGLFQLYLFGSRHGGILIPVAILVTVSAAAFLSMILSALHEKLPSWFNYGLIAPVCLIAVGVFILFKRK